MFELHCKTNFSFLVGASHADELIQRAQQLGYSGLAVTDENTLAGVVRAHVAAKSASMPLLIGAELQLQAGWPIVVWATSRKGYGTLSRLLTIGRRRAPKGECHLTHDDLWQHQDDLLAAIAPPQLNYLRTEAHGSRDSQPALDFQHPERVREAQQLRECFGDRAYLLAEFHLGVDDAHRRTSLQAFSETCRLPFVAAGDVHYHAPTRLPLHDILTAIRTGQTVAQIEAERFANAERHLRHLNQIHTLYEMLPGAIERTDEIAGRCDFSLDELRYEYPIELAPVGQTPMQYLEQLTWQGASQRYPAGIPDKVSKLLKHELQLISELRYEAYFLTVWDLVRFARERNILCQGRGSAANSAVCYCLQVTAVDPAHADLLFERFVSRERNEAPDIDVDFEHERREEVLQYLYDKYGRERAGLAAVVVTYRMRSAIRDVGKALGLSLDRVDGLAKQVEGYAHDDKLHSRCQQVGIDPESEMGRRLLHLVDELVGFPRHLSQHVGGMVMTQGPLCELVPIENAAMADRTVISWDKNDLEDLGILKVDCLALGMLTAIRKAFDLIEQHTGRHLTLANVPQDDPKVYRMICLADTMGVFQIESRAQMSMLPRLRPNSYYDLVVEVAIVRPGPIQGQMVHPYLRRRMGLESVEYPNDDIREVLHKTLGVPIFQEQAMRLAVVAAGFTPGEADELRRAMGAWRRTGVIDVFRQKLHDGMLQRGLSPEFAEQVFRQIRGFGEYGFPESHAASFALLVYISAWIKYYYPDVFAAALINSQPMGFYAPAQLVRDAQKHGVSVQPVDVNHSDWDCTLETATQDAENDSPNPDNVLRIEENETDRPLFALRLGLRLIHGLPVQAADSVVQARRQGKFASMQDLSRRARLNRAVTVRLSEADVFQSMGRNRRQALWEALGQEKIAQHGDDQPLFATLSPQDDALVNLPEQPDLESVFADYDATGLSLKAHPVSFYREQLNRLGVTPAIELPERHNGGKIKVAGIVLLRQRPSTAKGITFVTLEDETGTINLVIHQRTWERFYTIARRGSAWIVRGKLEMRQSIIHVIVQQLEDMPTQLRSLHAPSRDFR